MDKYSINASYTLLTCANAACGGVHRNEFEGILLSVSLPARWVPLCRHNRLRGGYPQGNPSYPLDETVKETVDH